MADRGDTHYHVPHLNLWFLFSSVFFLITMIWTVIDDWNAEWKGYQRGFRELELSKAEAVLDRLEESGMLELREEIQARVDAAEAKLGENKKAVAEAEADEYQKKEIRWKVENTAKKAKADFNWAKLQTEGRVAHGEIDAQEGDRLLADLRKESFESALDFEDKTVEWEDAKDRLAAVLKERTDAEKELAIQTSELLRVEARIDHLDPGQVLVQVANIVRDFPGMDFIGPNMKVRKHVLRALTFELNFTKKTRIDMCTTCHLGIDRAGFEGDEQPFTSHPRLDLYLSSKSPHPVKDVGCTICHRGSGEALSFQHVDHTPDDEEEKEAWEEKYHWHKQHHWDYPMLTSANVEAGCVQCHTTSMELIADDAPKVTEGYRLFERYGCYSCHKVEWFPTKRRPGPSLKNLAAKVTPEFVEPWIARPKSFRPTTWMPQLFHLENLAPDEVVVKANYGKGDEILGQAWNEASVGAITNFLFDRHPKEELPAIPVEGDAERGREVMNVSGCYGCHNVAPYDGEPTGISENLADVPGEYNVKGPNLRGVASKTDQKWVYHWLKDPSAYWSETNMPNLRLPDQDAADIAAYIMEDPDGIFTDVPDGWQEGRQEIERVVLEEQARWFYQKLGRREIASRLAGDSEQADWSDDQVLSVAIGEALVRNHGCYSCHEVSGLEDEMPIGTELTEWATKTVDKLDFGATYLHPGETSGEHFGRPKLDKHYREGWLERKLSTPRFYDLGKIKNPKDKLRMPWFDFTDEQVKAISCFVVGLVDDEVQLAKMEPTPEQLSTDAGMRAVRQKNCMACHVVEPGTVTFEDEHGDLMTVEGELSVFPEAAPPAMPPRMTSIAAFREDVAEWAEWNEVEEEELGEISVLLWGAQPDFGAPMEKVFVSYDKIVDVTPTVGGSFVRLITDYYRKGIWVPDAEHDPNDPESYPDMRWNLGFDEDAEVGTVEDVDGILRPYAGEEYSKVRWTFAPPVLIDEGHKLQRDWFYSFLKDPIPLREQVRVPMPTFHYGEGEAEAIADYFGENARLDWYSRYAKTLRLVLGRTLRDLPADNGWILPEQQLAWPTAALITNEGPGWSVEELAARSGIEAEKIREIEAGYMPTINATFGQLFQWGTEQGFAITGQPAGSYELVERRTPSHLAERAEFLDIGRRVGELAIDCYSCHPDAAGGFRQDPIAWAPALENVSDRLREEWVREWQWSPKLIYPGTTMPDNLSADIPQYQDHYPNSTNGQQISAILDWLYNMDRMPPEDQ